MNDANARIQFKTELLTNFRRLIQTTRCSQCKIMPRALPATSPERFNKPTRAVSSGMPNSSTQTLPRKITTAENK